jgi:hypothetical protein
MTSLNNFPELKRQLAVFQETEIMPAIILAVKEGNLELLLAIVKTFIETKSTSSLTTLEVLLHRIVNPGDEFGFDEPILKTDDFKGIFALLSQETAQKLADKKLQEMSSDQVTILSVVLRQLGYYILDTPEVQALAKMAKKSLSIDILTKGEPDILLITYFISIYQEL